MKNNKIIQLKKITALRLLGVNNEQIGELTGDSAATTRRYNDRLCRLLIPRGGAKQEQLKEMLWSAKQQVKGSQFRPKKDLTAVRNKLDTVLSTNGEKYVSFVWFGNVHKLPIYHCHTDEKLELRFITPKQPLFADDKSIERARKRLKNIGLSLKLMGLSNEEVDEFTNQLAGFTPSERLIIYDHSALSDESDLTHDLLRISPRIPANRTQKEKKRLIQFALKHLDRCSSNFVYAERFNRLPIDTSQVNADDGIDSWWVYGPDDILDWFECHEV